MAIAHKVYILSGKKTKNSITVCRTKLVQQLCTVLQAQRDKRRWMEDKLLVSLSTNEQSK